MKKAALHMTQGKKICLQGLPPIVLTLCILMGFPKHIDTISMGLPIEYFKESQVEFSKFWYISVPEGCLILANSWKG